MALPPPGPSNFVRRIPEGDDRDRLVCTDCGFVAYENPKVIVGAVVTLGDRFLLCRRAIPPRDGYWTLPAGHLEAGEPPDAGAMREAWEEARARIAIDALLAVYHIAHPSQVQLIYRATLTDPAVEAGPESREVRLVGWDEIPWDDIAFPSVRWALHHWRETAGRRDFAPCTNPPGEPPLEDPHASRGG